MTTDSQYLSPAELADEWGLPVSTLYQWRYRRVGPPAYRLGRHLRYKRSDAEQWLESQRDGAVAS